MKKQLEIFAILLTIAFTVSTFPNLKLFPTANATYVEGPITQDTIWTLVDSPFVVSKGVTVYPNATLTIEPGAEVKFGGAFYLIIWGRLYVNGTEKTITFTSNKEQPAAGDWGAIQFSGTNKSTLIGCSIAYATDGIFAENGYVEIRNSDIRFCRDNGINIANAGVTVYNSIIEGNQGNGIYITNTNLTVYNSVIEENQGSGICITGNGQVIIQQSTVMANGNGILLTGSDVSNVNITENRISANNQGIRIDANTHTNIEIVNNVVSSDDIGFYISSPTSTYITSNSISYNNIGFLYDEGSHAVNYTDIYGNKMGMDVLSNATVNAEYNYWGDPSGPYHVSLNPKGRGNPVGGNGVNLDFIFFLSKSISRINTPPTANLLTDKVWVRPNEIVMFFATNSYDGDGRVDKYFFDFGDDDSGWITLSIFTHKYSTPGNYSASLKVMDDNGTVSNVVSTTIYVDETLPSLYASLELGSSMVHEGEQVSIVVYVTDGISAVENATVTMLSVKGGTFTQPVGLTNADGYFVTTFTAPDVTEKANVRIIARTSKIGYTDGSDYEYLEVSPFLSVQIAADPTVIKSEGGASITINVKSNEQPIANASVTVLSSNGSLSSETGITNSSGMFSLVFTAPQTTTTSSVTITATAKKSGYMDGVGQTAVAIEPKILDAKITAESVVTISEAKLNVTVHVEYETAPIVEANVSITAENGNFSTTTGLTDSNGNVTFVFTAPAVNEQTNINIKALATKDRYAENQSQLQITVNPRTFNIEITAPTVNSEETATVMVHVTCKEDTTSVSNATVRISSSEGSLSDTTEVTDSNGYCTFIFNAPKTTTQLPAIITVNVTKNGYTNGENQTTTTVNPKAIAEGGWPIMTILLIIIPIAILVIVVVLIKLKIIGISSGEKE